MRTEATAKPTLEVMKKTGEIRVPPGELGADRARGNKVGRTRTGLFPGEPVRQHDSRPRAYRSADPGPAG